MGAAAGTYYDLIKGVTIKIAFKHQWRIAWGIIGAMIGILVVLLFWEYHSLRQHSQKVQALQDQYYEYVDMMKKVLRKKKIDESMIDEEADENDDLEVDSFLVINRAPIYLKESALNFVKEQQLESLLDQMNLHEMHNYTDQVLSQAQEKPVLSSTRKAAHVTRGRSRRTSSVRRRPSATGIEFSWPIVRNKFWLSSFFGPRKKPNGQWGFHKGIDMAAQRGTPVHASVAGIVEQAGYQAGYGNTVVISHDKVYKTRYAHLDAIYVRKNQKVRTGQRIGAVGDTGFIRRTGKDGSHLHFELYERGKQVNPLYLLPPKK